MIKRMHVAVNCTDSQKSLGFYRSFFGAEPTKIKDNYAKFELDQPALHFSLNVRPFEKKGVLNHLGFQVNDTEEVLAIGERLKRGGLLLIDEMNTTCCYAVQDKVCVHDLDGNAWEIFNTKEDSEFESAGEQRDLSLDISNGHRIRTKGRMSDSACVFILDLTTYHGTWFKL